MEEFKLKIITGFINKSVSYNTIFAIAGKRIRKLPVGKKLSELT